MWLARNDYKLPSNDVFSNHVKARDQGVVRKNED